MPEPTTATATRNKRILYPRALPVYDEYCEAVFHPPENLGRVMHGLDAAVPYDMRLLREVQDDLEKALRTSRVYAVDDGAVAELHRAFAKETKRATVYSDAPPDVPFPAPPHVPMWIEFLGDGINVGNGKDVPTHHVQAIMIRASSSGDSYRFLLIGYDTREQVDRSGTRSPLAILELLPTQMLNVLPDGTWVYEQGQCSSAQCPVAQHTNEFFERGLSAILQTQHAGLAAQTAGVTGHHCLCYVRATTWYLLIRLLLWLISAEGIGATVEERRATVRDDLPMKKDIARETRAEVDAWNRDHAPRYTRISLSSHTIVRYVQDADGKRHKVVEHLTDENSVKRLIGHHRRFLYPGPGKPWRTAQILVIEPFMRSVRTKAAVPTTRYLVTE